jgi:myo-inositol 2-dehydrogenase / D-chiro-inositol 1-dehydrogenase
MPKSNRRDFLKAGGVALAASSIPAVHAAGGSQIKVGLIGCGGRGSGAFKDIMTADKDKYIVIHAIGDVFEDKAKAKAKEFGEGQFKDRVKIEDRAFFGVDAYKKVIDSGIDLVMLATPPGFRPNHLEYAVKAGKHIFTEKPVAVDAAGIRKVMALVEESKKKNLAIVAGTQRRHQPAYLEAYKRVKDGAIGEIVGGRCSWNDRGIWFNKRREGMSDVEYQLSNWYHFMWICGDHIVEQHVHNLDVMNWFIGKHPTRVVGMGGRMGGHNARPTGPVEEVGNIFDHFAVEFDYGPGLKISSYCRHFPGVSDVSELIVGTKGWLRPGGSSFVINGKTFEVDDNVSPYVQEHIDLLKSLKDNTGKHINELQNVTESTMTAIMGRMAAYSGQGFTWEEAINVDQDTMPKQLDLKGKLAVDPLPVPGKTVFKPIATKMDDKKDETKPKPKKGEKKDDKKPEAKKDEKKPEVKKDDKKPEKKDDKE